ncbi:MAG TPA: hypothetical protein VMH87_08705 [Pseudomonadales bacterium]|nr:hypothetical protein [Pseudomonadales bacterium]
MGKPDTKRELEALLKAAEKNRIELQKSWKKVEDLEAAIQAAQRAQSDSKAKRKEKGGQP